MKKQTLKTLLVATLIGMSGFAMAGNGEDTNRKSKIETSRTLEVNIYPRNNGLVAVNFEKNNDEDVSISIYNIYGEKIYTERIKSHEIVAKKYDISRLPSSTYYFEVANDNYLVRQVVNK